MQGFRSRLIQRREGHNLEDLQSITDCWFSKIVSVAMLGTKYPTVFIETEKEAVVAPCKNDETAEAILKKIIREVSEPESVEKSIFDDLVLMRFSEFDSLYKTWASGSHYATADIEYITSLNEDL